MKITSLKQLVQLAHERKSVLAIIYSCPIRLPAAFVVNMQGVRIQQIIEAGMSVYKKKGKR